MAENQTTPTTVSVADFIETIEHAGRREDAAVLVDAFEKWTGWKAQMWGPSIIGFGRYAYTYDSGRSGEMLATGFSPRKANMVLYIGRTFEGSEELFAKLGKYKTSKACLYVGRLSSIDMNVLERIIKKGVAVRKKKSDVHPS